MSVLRSFVGAATVAVSLGFAASAAQAAAPATTGRAFVAVSVPDLKIAASWYEQAFGLKTLHEIKVPNGEAHILILSSDKLLVELLWLRDAKPLSAEQIKDRHLVHGIFKAGLYVDDLDATVAHLRTLSTKFDTQIVDDAATKLRFVLVRDPAGNFIQLFGTPK